ncbi:hypothetical protein [Selenomonas sp. AB3002]|uniref:hypothetical protein n=1 Tax=Selenomonas sp. AB3002 TaxID=1392502 RepID=UPI0004950626
MEYSLNAQQYEQNGQNGYPPVSNVVLYVDLAKVFDSYANGMQMAFQMGRQAKTDELCLTPGQKVARPSLPPAASGKNYLGVYDHYAYGVYDDEAKYSNSLAHWHGATLNTSVFPSYEEALSYARNGVAASRGVDVGSIQPLTNRLNWRQQA